MAAPRSMSMHLAPERSALETARLAVLQFLQPHAVPPRAIYAVELLLEEALSNVIAGGGGDSPVGLGVDMLDDAVELRLDDAGPAFNPLDQAPSPRPASIAEAVPGGLGLLLIRRYARSVAYQRSAGRNVLSMTVAL